jgi:hypothetical protein
MTSKYWESAVLKILFETVREILVSKCLVIVKVSTPSNITHVTECEESVQSEKTLLFCKRSLMLD